MPKLGRRLSLAASLILLSMLVGALLWAHTGKSRAAAATAAPLATPQQVAGQTVAVPLATVVPRRVFVVGDSLTVGTEPWLPAALRARGWTLTGVSARVGRPVAEGLRVLRQRRAHLPGTVLLALGTNDLGSSPSQVSTWLRDARAIVGKRRLIWVNLCLSPGGSSWLAGYRQINASLSRFAPRYGVTIADWCSYAGRHGITNGPDGIHYGPSAYRQRARFYALSLGRTAG